MQFINKVGSIGAQGVEFTGGLRFAFKSQSDCGSQTNHTGQPVTILAVMILNARTSARDPKPVP